MALSSMTGFARVSFEAGGAKYSWELKSVNARGLEIRLRLPPGLEHLEPEMRAQIRESLARGTCFAGLQKEGESESARLVLNEEALAIVLAAARRLATEHGVAMPTADGLLAIPGVLQDGATALESEAAEQRDAAVLRKLRAALEALVVARFDEGKRLQAVLDEQLSTIARLTSEAAQVAGQAPEAIRARIRDQIALITADKNNLDPDRLHQEAVLLATRADVREELDRLSSHVSGARALLASAGAVGRQLEFLTQEFNREANTLCSKAFDRRLTAIGIALKTTIDQMREQAQNLA